MTANAEVVHDVARTWGPRVSFGGRTLDDGTIVFGALLR